MAPKQIITWIILTWAVVSGCFVTDLWDCPWTAVFDAQPIKKEAYK
jgi:hypothetical protein